MAESSGYMTPLDSETPQHEHVTFADPINSFPFPSNRHNYDHDMDEASFPSTPRYEYPHKIQPLIPADISDLDFAVPKRAMRSFENLVALANQQERLREAFADPKKTLHVARKIVWRDKGQPVVQLDTLKACLLHASHGGFRAATLAFNLRAALNVVLALIRIHRVPRDLRLTTIRRAIFGLESLRFSAMLGTFASLYKFIINALPLLIPAIQPRSADNAIADDDDKDVDADVTTSLPMPSNAPSSLALPALIAASNSTLQVPKLTLRRPRLSLSAHAQMILIRKKTRRWHAALAGSVAGGLAIMLEARSRRGVIAQQMFVRGLQGSYNAYTTKHGISVPNGDVLVFALACGQILYGFLLRPDTLPRSYITWIGQAGKIPAESVRINHDLVRGHPFNPADVHSLLAHDDISPANHATLTSFLTLPLSTIQQDPYAPCAAVHPPISSCLNVPLDRFFTVSKWMLPIYGALHFIPAVLFKRKSFMRDPGRTIVRSGVGAVRSSAFLGVFVTIYQAAYCYKHYLYRLFQALPKTSRFRPLQFVIDLLISRASFWVSGFLSGLALFVEARRRRGELAMYVLPKALESFWIMARGKGLVFQTGKYGEVLLTSIGMGMVMSTYQNDPQHLSGLVRRILYQFIGPN